MPARCSKSSASCTPTGCCASMNTAAATAAASGIGPTGIAASAPAANRATATAITPVPVTGIRRTPAALSKTASSSRRRPKRRPNPASAPAHRTTRRCGAGRRRVVRAPRPSSPCESQRLASRSRTCGRLKPTKNGQLAADDRRRVRPSDAQNGHASPAGKNRLPISVTIGVCFATAAEAGNRPDCPSPCWAAAARAIIMIVRGHHPLSAWTLRLSRFAACFAIAPAADQATKFVIGIAETSFTVSLCDRSGHGAQDCQSS